MSRRRRILAAATAGVLLLALSPQGAAPRLVWNASPSVPPGLYLIAPAALRRGDLVLVRLPPDIAKLAHRRGYLPRSVYLIKFVRAIAGDQVCRLGTQVLVRGVFVASALPRDRSGRRRMPVWHGCRWLGHGELFVLADNPQSLDSRYFGPISIGAIIGRAVLLWS